MNLLQYLESIVNMKIENLKIKAIDEERLIGIIKQATTSGQLTQVLHVEDDDEVHTVVSYMLQDHCHLTRSATLAEARVSGVLVKSKMDNAHLSETLHQLIAGNFE